MQWRKPLIKNNGDVRKQLKQWAVPKEIRDKLKLVDGCRCKLCVRIGDFSIGPIERKLTSGGEIYLPKHVGDSIHAESTRLMSSAMPDPEIVFEIEVDRDEISLDQAREKAISDGAFDLTDDHDARERIMALIARRQGQPAFRKKLLDAYGNRCAISRCDCPDALEAAHIRPYKGEHTNHIKNGILLRSDIHTLFDLGMINIDSSYTVTVCDELRSTVYKKYDGKRLHLPKRESDWPDCSV